MLGYTKGFREWHKVTAQGQVRDFCNEDGESIGPPHQRVSLTVCKLRLANLQLSDTPTDSDPVCPICGSH